MSEPKQQSHPPRQPDPNIHQSAPNAGQPVQQVIVQQVAPPEKPKNSMALAGFVLSFFIAPLCFIFSAVGLSNALKNNNVGLGFAIAGLVISSMGILFWFSVFGAFGSAVNEINA